MFDDVLTYSNHLGLFSEDIDFNTKEQLGNFPQAYSHLALVMLKKVRTGKRPISIPEKAFMQENHQGKYFPVSGEVVPIFANEKMTGMAIVCRNISEEEMQRRFFNMAVEESAIYPWQYNH